MGKSSSLSEYWRLLELAEDYFRDGMRRPHEPLNLPPQPPPAAPRAGPTPSTAGPASRSMAAEEPSPAMSQRPAAQVNPGEAGAKEGEAAVKPGESAVKPGEAGLAAIAAEVLSCTRCALHRGRTRAVPGEGASNPLVLVIGEGPGAEEDASGRPFVGPAGQYLDRMLKAIQLDRATNCFIANVVKCRPPGNRDPLPEESEACLPYLRAQIAALRPRAILAVGRVAARTLTGLSAGVGELRRRQLVHEGIPLAVTYHPSAVLRDSGLRRPVWEDLQRLRAALGHA